MIRSGDPGHRGREFRYAISLMEAHSGCNRLNCSASFCTQCYDDCPHMTSLQVHLLDWLAVFYCYTSLREMA